MTTTEANAAIVECTRCGKEIPTSEARPYWHLDWTGELEKDELCAKCAGTGVVEIVRVGLTDAASPVFHTRGCLECDGTGRVAA